MNITKRYRYKNLIKVKCENKNCDQTFYVKISEQKYTPILLCIHCQNIMDKL